MLKFWSKLVNLTRSYKRKQKGMYFLNTVYIHINGNILTLAPWWDYSRRTHNINNKLIKRWDSERELFYDDIVHVEASAYAHWTDFLISTKHLRYLPTHPSNRVLTWTRPSNLLSHNGPAHCYKKLIRRYGHRQLQSDVDATASSSFAKIIAE